MDGAVVAWLLKPWLGGGGGPKKTEPGAVLKFGFEFEFVLADPSVIEGDLFGSSIGSLKPKKSVLLLSFEDIVAF